MIMVNSGSPLPASWSLYERSESCVCILGVKLHNIGVRLCQGCVLSAPLFVVLLDTDIKMQTRLLRLLPSMGLKVTSLLFADDVVLLVPSEVDL